jgi:hypothetical protein
LEQEHSTGRQARSFTRWNQLVHLAFIQLTARTSLRDGVASLKARFKNLYHWHYFAKLDAIITTQSFQDLHLPGTLPATREDIY